jgi:hypothetical protein
MACYRESFTFYRSLLLLSRARKIHASPKARADRTCLRAYVYLVRLSFRMRGENRTRVWEQWQYLDVSVSNWVLESWGSILGRITYKL